jgi:hypothetical protein
MLARYGCRKAKDDPRAMRKSSSGSPFWASGGAGSSRGRGCRRIVCVGARLRKSYQFTLTFDNFVGEPYKKRYLVTTYNIKGYQ